MNLNEINYALSKQIPDMLANGFTIQTNYGELRISTRDAMRFVITANILLQKQADMELKNETHR